MINNLTDANFDQEITKSEKPVLVDFFATWCHPCTVLGPVLDKVSEEMKEKIAFAKVNVDEFPQTSQKFSIDSIPTVILFSKGKAVGGFVGLMQESDIKRWLDDAMSKI